jgi:hypothetical protein
LRELVFKFPRLAGAFVELGCLVVGSSPVFQPEEYCYTADDQGKGSKDAGDNVFCGVV